MPLTAGPRTVRALRWTDISRLACLSWSRGTSCGITLAIAGKLIDMTVPCTAVRTTSCQISACPEITRTAMASWHRPETTLENWMTRVRPNRSAITPPARRNTTIGMLCAASTTPSAVAELLTSSTAKARATLAITPPTEFTSREKK